MRQLDAQALARLLDRPSLIDALDDAFRTDITVPLRHHHTMAETNAQDSTLLLMPAWDDSTFIGIKIVTVVPRN